MHQISIRAIGSRNRIRLHHIRARAWTVVGVVGLLASCVQTVTVFTEAPRVAKFAIRDRGLEKNPLVQPPVSASPGPASSPAERSLPGPYSEEYWTAVADLDLTGMRKAAGSEEIGFAEGIALLAAGDPEKAESFFDYLSRQAIDVNVAVASQIMLATTLLYERKWTMLRDLSADSSRGRADREDISNLERWGHAFANLDQQITSFPVKPVSLPLKLTPAGTPTVLVRINGKDYEFWLDTGTSTTVLSSDVALDADVPTLSPDTLTVRTFAGVAPVRPAVIKRMEIGPFVFANSPAIVIDASLMRVKATAQGVPWAGLQVDGIIGWDTIRQLDVEMDYQTGIITLGRPDSLETSGTTSQNLTWMGKPLVAVRTSGGTMLHFTLDTGSQASFLNASTLAKVELATRASTAHVFGIARTDGKTGRVVPALALEVAGRVLRLQGVIVYGPASSGLISCDGILGSDIAQFGKIRIDATNGLFAVE